MLRLSYIVGIEGLYFVSLYSTIDVNTEMLISPRTSNNVYEFCSIYRISEAATRGVL